MSDKTVIINIFGECCEPRSAPKVFFKLWTGPQSFTLVLANQGKEAVMARLTTEEMFENVTVEPKTGKGNPAPVDGQVAFASSDEAVVRVDRIDDLHVNLVAVGLGVCQVTADADADMDPGEERHINASVAIEVVAAEAQTLEINVGAAVPQP